MKCGKRVYLFHHDLQHLKMKRRGQMGRKGRIGGGKEEGIERQWREHMPVYTSQWVIVNVIKVNAKW